MDIKKILMLAAVGVSTLAAPMSAFADSQVANTADKAIVKKISYSTLNNIDARRHEDVKIRVDFKEDFRNQIKPGDKLVFDIPAELKAVNKTIPLEKDGKGIFGNVVITNGQAVLEFNQTVKAYDHIEGFFEIGARVVAEIAEDTTIQVPMNLGTSLDVQKLTIANPKPNGNRNDFGYKGGEQDIDDPEHIKWWLVMNSENVKVLSDVTVTDKVGVGHKMVPETLLLNGKPYKQAEADGDIVIDYLDETGFKITVKREKVAGSFTYKTKINADAHKQAEMPNFFRIEGLAEGYVNQVWAGERKVKNLLALDGGIDGNQDEKHATEGTQEMPEENVDVITDPAEENINGSEVQDETHPLDGKNPLTEQEIKLIEETLTEEQWEVIEEILDQHINGEVEGDHTHQIEINGESMTLTDTELIEELLTPEQIETLKEIIEEHGIWSVIEQELVTPEVHSVDVKSAPKAAEKKSEVAPKTDTKKSQDEKTTTEKKSNVQKTEKTKSLPNTGYQNNNFLVLFGLLALLGSAILLFKKSKTNN